MRSLLYIERHGVLARKHRNTTSSKTQSRPKKISLPVIVLPQIGREN